MQREELSQALRLCQRGKVRRLTFHEHSFTRDIAALGLGQTMYSVSCRVASRRVSSLNAKAPVLFN